MVGRQVDEPQNHDEVRGEPFHVSIDVAQPARVRDAVLGGSANFWVDRMAAEELASAMPGGADALQLILRANGAFRARAVRHLVAEVGVRQFLQVGTSVPIGRTTHEVAQEIAPDCRIVHCIDDPVALAHAQKLKGAPEGSVDFVHGSLSNPASILARAAVTLDLSQPVALATLAISVVPDDEDPWRAAAELVAGLPSGSYLMLVQLGNDINAELFNPVGERQKKLAAEGRMRPLNARSRADVERFFEGLEVLEPGIVRVDQWRPDDDAPTLPGDLVTPFYCAVGRKPVDQGRKASTTPV